jgi:hypothetical protein
MHARLFSNKEEIHCEGQKKKKKKKGKEERKSSDREMMRSSGSNGQWVSFGWIFIMPRGGRKNINFPILERKPVSMEMIRQTAPSFVCFIFITRNK